MILLLRLFIPVYPFMNGYRSNADLSFQAKKILFEIEPIHFASHNSYFTNHKPYSCWKQSIYVQKAREKLWIKMLNVRILIIKLNGSISPKSMNVSVRKILAQRKQRRALFTLFNVICDIVNAIFRQGSLIVNKLTDVHSCLHRFLFLCIFLTETLIE